MSDSVVEGQVYSSILENTAGNSNLHFLFVSFFPSSKPRTACLLFRLIKYFQGTRYYLHANTKPCELLSYLLLFHVRDRVYKFDGMNFSQVCGWLGTLLENVYDFLDNGALFSEERALSSFRFCTDYI